MTRALVVLAAAAVLVLACPCVRAGIGIGTIEEDPAVTHEKWKRKAEEDYKTGMEARAAGNKAQAVKFLMRAYDIGRRYRIDSPYPQKAADALSGLARDGLRELDVARDLVGGEAPQAGLLELKRITRTYFGLPPAKQAGALLRQLEGDPAFQARLRAAELAEQLARAEALEARAAALVADADLNDVRTETPAEGEKAAETKPAVTEEGEGAGRAPEEAGSRVRPLTKAERQARRLDLLAEAHAVYARVAEQGQGNEVGKQAEAARRRLEQDSGLMVRIRQARAEDQAREWLGLGTNYMRAGRTDLAREYFEKILAECPDAPQAHEARGLLDGMTK